MAIGDLDFSNSILSFDDLFSNAAGDIYNTTDFSPMSTADYFSSFLSPYDPLMELLNDPYLSAGSFYPEASDYSGDLIDNYFPDVNWPDVFNQPEFDWGQGDGGSGGGGGAGSFISQLGKLLLGSGGAAGLLGSGGLAGLLTSPLAGLLAGGALGGLGAKGTEWHTTPGLPGAMEDYNKTLSGAYLSPDNPAWQAMQSDITENFQKNIIPQSMGNWYSTNRVGPPSSDSGFATRMDDINRGFGKTITNAYLTGVFNPERTRMTGYGMQGLPQTYSTNPYAGMLGGGISGLAMMKMLNDMNNG